MKELYYMTDVLNENGLRLGDEMTLKSFGERPLKLLLNRTQFEFKTKIEDEKSSACVKYLESIQNEKIHFKMSLIETNAKYGKKHTRYYIESMNEIPFVLNGSYVMSAFLERSSQVEIGYHKLSFQSIHKDISRSHPFLQNQDLVRSRLPILLEGETGTGKSYLAKKIHEQSQVPGLFIHVNLCSFSPTLIESELFGHIKGAFTGAVNEKKGALREAHRGTLFLDEIDSLSLEMQTKLLLFLESFEVRSVGSSVSRKVDTRIICASGQNLETLVKEKKMRADFYFRISSGFKYRMKPLREDKSLIRKTIESYAKENKLYVCKNLLNYYEDCLWPGNIRQLKGQLIKKHTMNRGAKLSLDDLDDELKRESSLFPDQIEKSLSLESIKARHARSVYLSNYKNKRVSSRLLGISQKSLNKLLSLQY